MTPREFAAAALAALEAAEGRRRSRKRDQTPDAIGLALKRALLQRAVAEDPPEQAFEEWLLGYAANPMAPAVLEEWRMARASPDFAAWLANGAPSDDAQPRAPGKGGTLLALLAAMALTACDADRQAVPDPAKPPKPRVVR